MTNAQQKDLFTEWARYEPIEQRLMIDEYITLTSKGDCSKSRFLDFLKNKLDIEGYWAKSQAGLTAGPISVLPP